MSLFPVNRRDDHTDGYICGIFYTNQQGQRQYLPRVKLNSHTQLTPISFTTSLKQTFSNPGHSATPYQLRYLFPLFDGVPVCEYAISFADKKLVGTVKQKDDAKKTYKAAVDRGSTAGLFENLPASIFGVTLGYIPPNIDIVVEIQYCGELQHDVGIDGLRYTLPTSIAPRYGNIPEELCSANASNRGGITITVDANMRESAIRRIQSPTHPIAVTMGMLSTDDEQAPRSTSKACATLTAGSAELGQDFILQLIVDNISKPQAIIETHSTFPNQRAIMATLVTGFALKPIHPEIVFVADQSGSMQGTKNEMLIASLSVFLRSLPFGTRFNVVSFGSTFRSLWPTSQAYNENNLKAALDFVSLFGAQLGGTEILQPIRFAFDHRLKDLPLEVMLLTDGEIWDEGSLFSYISSQIKGSGSSPPIDARIFTLGIGGDVSHSLVEGLARSANGFAQYVTGNEDASPKVMRMLKAALYPHTKNHTLEVRYADQSVPNDQVDHDFEMVENEDDSATSQAPETEQAAAKPAPAISCFDEKADLDADVFVNQDRYSHLPEIEIPAEIQAPAQLPQLFPFHRSAAYILLGPDAPRKTVTSLILRAESADGPLELEIPVQSCGIGRSVHQMAARKAIQDLEDGRGWLETATITSVLSGEGWAEPHKRLVKAAHSARFHELIEREAVRLGVRFQVTGQWTSFVAVEDGKESTGYVDVPANETLRNNTAPFGGSANHTISMKRRAFPPPPAPGGLFGSSMMAVERCSHSSTTTTAPPPMAFGQASPATKGGLFGSSLFASRASPAAITPCPPPPAFPAPAPLCAVGTSYAPMHIDRAKESDDEDGETFRIRQLHSIIALQCFSGAFESSVVTLMNISARNLAASKEIVRHLMLFLSAEKSDELCATMLTLAYLKKHHASRKGVWEMIGDKGRDFLESVMGEESARKACKEAATLV